MYLTQPERAKNILQNEVPSDFVFILKIIKKSTENDTDRLESYIFVTWCDIYGRDYIRNVMWYIRAWHMRAMWHMRAVIPLHFFLLLYTAINISFELSIIPLEIRVSQLKYKFEWITVI